MSLEVDHDRQSYDERVIVVVGIDVICWQNTACACESIISALPTHLRPPMRTLSVRSGGLFQRQRPMRPCIVEKCTASCRSVGRLVVQRMSTFFFSVLFGRGDFGGFPRRRRGTHALCTVV